MKKNIALLTLKLFFLSFEKKTQIDYSVIIYHIDDYF